LREELNNILARCTGQSIKKIQADTERDFFMSGEEAVQYGLVDNVITSREVDKKIEVVSGQKK
jgi:ATP-dependent Clp protease protease subunit